MTEKDLYTYIIFRVKSDYEIFNTFDELKEFVLKNSYVNIRIKKDVLILYNINNTPLASDTNELYAKMIRYYATKSIISC
jgi:hypothetical protein